MWIETVEHHIALQALHVAPRRGVWIETIKKSDEINKAKVAPRRGVWIETPISLPLPEDFCRAP